MAFQKLYNFDFAGAHATLDPFIAAHPTDPLPYAVKAAVYLFNELDRLHVLEGEFLGDDKRIAEKKKLRPDPANRQAFYKMIEAAESRAKASLAGQPDDKRALFAMVVAQGVVLDYTALIDKRQIGSLSNAKRSNSYAQRLLKLDPNFFDAYAATGLTEYLVGSLPFFVRWFVHFEEVKGSKEQAFTNLRLVAQKGHYLKPFAKILLSIAYMREKQPQQTRALLAELAREFPNNSLFRKELAILELKVKGGL